MINIHQVREKVRTILLTTWDPIDVRDVQQARDEYDAYITPIARMVAAGASISRLQQHLLEIETSAMGLNGDGDRAWSAAEQLVKVRELLAQSRPAAKHVSPILRLAWILLAGFS